MCDLNIIFIKACIYLWKRIIIHKFYCKLWISPCFIPSTSALAKTEDFM
ncbi:hypothetical protein PHAVU_007G163200 [Phaseolus vulgaris]|uniref:Uncharacterized protein n=1 Tax=Phaseolus vulgaris TaxID=3885 RepID=V7BF86_PHAVU|nr:hypothetical protein PHAVU_007G163200g [Phaseolus vulgaris]ESW16519.1 hypothetical protein PHAVU_007G163200g [Phaseolus vulgaris]